MSHRWMAGFCVMWLLAASAEAAAGAVPFGEWVTTGPPIGFTNAVTLVERTDAAPLLFGSNAGEVREYRPETGEWTTNGALQILRGGGGATATLLPSGILLVAGMSRSLSTPVYPAPPLPTPAVELYDPATGSSTITGSMRFGRMAHQATLLASGHVLVSGGMDASTLPIGPTEIYDPATGAWTVAGALNQPRTGHAAVRLANGKVLVAGGSERFGERPLASAEVYDPATGVWTLVAPMDRSRVIAAGVPLVDGRVLVAGESRSPGVDRLSVDSQIYDPAKDAWTPSITLSSTNFAAGLAVLRDGTPLLVFGDCPPRSGTCGLTGAAVFDLSTESWNPTGPVGTQFSTAAMQPGAVLPDGRALFASGAPSVAVLFRPDNTTPRLVVSPPSIDFGKVDGGQAADRVVSVENTGGASLAGTATAAAPFSVVSGSPFTLPPGAKATVTLRFSPIETGSFFDAVQFASNGNWPSVSVSGTNPKGVRLSGRVVDARGVGVGTIGVYLSGVVVGQTLTDDQGNYEFAVRANNRYRIFPVNPGLVFTPIDHFVTVGSEAVSGLDFTTPFADEAATFVAGLYREISGRPPDPGGVISWTGTLRSRCDAEGLRRAVTAFFGFPEFRTSRPLTLPDLVTVLYRALLAREPQAEERAYWAGLLRQDRVALANQFVASAEFRSLLPDRTNRPEVTAIVTRLYTGLLGRVPDPSEVTSWVAYVVATGDAEGAAVAFVTSREFEQRPLTFRDYVTLLYRAILGRDPETAGLDYWESVLQSSLLSIKDQFLSSAEFQARIPSLCGT